MIKNNAYYKFYASYLVPNSNEVGYWIDLGADSKGRVIKVYNNNTKQWILLANMSGEDSVAPYIGNNGNWFVDNRDTGVDARGQSPYVGSNYNWYIYDPSEKKYVDSGIKAKSQNAYELAVDLGFIGTEEEWIASLKAPAVDAANAAIVAAADAIEAAAKANEATDALFNTDLSGIATKADLDNYLALAGGTMTTTDVISGLNADKIDGYDASELLEVAITNGTAPDEDQKLWIDINDAVSDPSSEGATIKVKYDGEWYKVATGGGNTIIPDDLIKIIKLNGVEVTSENNEVDLEIPIATSISTEELQELLEI